MKTIFDTVQFYQDLTKDYNIQQMQEWSNSPERFDDLEEFDYSIQQWINMDFWNQVEVELDNIKYDLNDFALRYNKRYNTVISLELWIGTRSSRYGSIGGAGASVGALVNNIDELINMSNASDFDIVITDEKHLEINFHDHDGTNSMKLSFIPESLEYKNGDNVVSYEGRRPTKLDKEFINSFGGLK